MSNQNEEDIVNACLGIIGESPVSSVLVANPAVKTILQILRSTNRLNQSKGYWFNTERNTLQPDAINGRIVLPNSTLKAKPTDPFSKLIHRGQYLYDTEKSTNRLQRPIELDIVYQLPYDELPVIFYENLKNDVVLQFATNMALEPQVLTVYSALLKKTSELLQAEDLIHRNISILDSPVGFALTKRLNPSTIGISRGKAW